MNEQEPQHINTWEHRSWGDHIEIMDWASGSLSSHLPFSVREGDFIYFETKKSLPGQVMKTRISNVRRPGDPADMAFLTVEAVVYCDRQAEKEK